MTALSGSAYPHLLEPLDLGFIRLRNRSLMGSMHVGLEECANGFKRLAAFYAARARGGVGLIVTGGYAPNADARGKPDGEALISADDVAKHKQVPEAVHAQGGLIAAQLLHTGRYAYHDHGVGPSAIQAPINPFVPRSLSSQEVNQTIEDYARAAARAREAGYDGVEIMGSEGYLINQFIALHTNQRTDEWGGAYENRMRLPVEIVCRTRERVGDDFLIVYRLSMLDLVPEGSTLDEVIRLGQAVEAAGANIINTGIGWHEARIPTIAMHVPRAAYAWVTALVKPHLTVPLVAVNRINTPELAEQVLARGDADMVSMARPLLADPELINKAAAGRADEINTCIACNQACLDHIFELKTASCLVNPLACFETEILIDPSPEPKRVAVVGAGPAGLACATTLAARGHQVTLFEGSDRIGGQLKLALRVPGKEEFAETLRYFTTRMERSGVDLRLSTLVRADDLDDFERVVVATGVRPRPLVLPGAERPEVLSYLDVLLGAQVGRRVAIIGAGGIGFDVAEFLTCPGGSCSLDREAFLVEWGIDTRIAEAGGLKATGLAIPSSERIISMMQRKPSKLGRGLGKTTGWIHRTRLAHKGIEMLAGVTYLRVDDEGLHIELDGKVSCLAVDNVVVCAGQEPARELFDTLQAKGCDAHLIGGASEATELDAKRAIREGTLLGASL